MNQKTLMDEVDPQAYAEWRDHPATKLLLRRLSADVAELRTTILEKVKAFDLRYLGIVGTNLGSIEQIIFVITERSDG
jgi:hypothetical protein